MNTQSSSVRMSVNGHSVRAGSCWAHFAREVPCDADRYEITISHSDLARIPGEPIAMEKVGERLSRTDYLLNALLNLDRDDTVHKLTWIIVSVDASSSDGVHLLIQGRCRPFYE